MRVDVPGYIEYAAAAHSSFCTFFPIARGRQRFRYCVPRFPHNQPNDCGPDVPYVFSAVQVSFQHPPFAPFAFLRPSLARREFSVPPPPLSRAKFFFPATTDAPVCKQDSAVVYVGSRGDEVQVVCEVLAHPDLVSFQWSFDGGGGASRALHSGFSGDRATLSSVMRYTPLADADFGTLLCRANNSAGHQRRPCMFHIVQASK
ncbi:hypothetical protein HPB48_002203 [Haemaphysalis longicornis]|uniref:Ig-like domain-containing protein n=1 Tax=Haemaphysalis longicornis TaxID=44386 RepID=A0A9J6FIR2_HAELO|nr:hypothetical protein HPB48_002203 [Haemaphysalis longicornis]